MSTTSFPKILIVDNDETVLIALERALETEGYSTATALTYQEASVLLQKHRFDVLVLDDQLSDRDAIDVLLELRCVERIPPLIIVTYHLPLSASDEARLQALSVDAICNKRDHCRLAQTIRSLFEEHASERESASRVCKVSVQ